jgi:hypothetical protein|tara:strand:+ start:343 stop:714 length:372 start_codon:yes stop_codon:yes gene_type:complete
MATNATWTVVFDDKKVINQSVNHTAYEIDDDSFWNDPKFSNIWAIQYGTTPSDDAVEYRDSTSHTAYDSSVLGNFNDFITRWDSAHLTQLQSDWDNDNVDGETAEQKINRLGAKPTSFSSPAV